MTTPDQITLSMAVTSLPDERVIDLVQRHISAMQQSVRWWQEYLRDNPDAREMSITDARAAGLIKIPGD